MSAPIAGMSRLFASSKLRPLGRELTNSIIEIRYRSNTHAELFTHNRGVNAGACPRQWRQSSSASRLLLSSKEAVYPGRKAMEWFKQKTSIVGVQVSNWMIVLGAIIIVLLIFQNLH
jgi:hypothetical protein